MSFKKLISVVLMLLLTMDTCAQAQNRELFSFTADVDLSSQKLFVKINTSGSNTLTLDFTKKSEGRYEILANIEHWSTALFELSTILNAVIELTDRPGSSLPDVSGKINSQYTLIDYLPVQDFYGQFQIHQGQFIIDSLLIGEVLCKGNVSLTSSHNVALQLSLTNLDLYKFLNFILQHPSFSAEGFVNGDIQLAGPLLKPYLRGHLTSEGGRVDKWTFNAAEINLEGQFPNVELTRSTLIRGDGLIFGVTGNLDLSQRKTYVKQIKALILLPYVQRGGEKAEWTLKRSDDDGHPGQTELKYILRNSDPIPSTPAGDPEGVMGVEHKVNF